MTEATSPPAGGDADVLLLHVRPDTLEWGTEDDDRWRSDLAELQHLLRRELRDETQEPPPAAGNRGAAEISDVIVALGSAGAMTAAVEVFKSWINARPGRRQVTVTIEGAGVEQRSVCVQADGLGAAELRDLAAQALGSGPGTPPAGEAEAR
ncbi:effector-associated constant component EACC1 [Angustibacter luteus]|uniref:Uncharacterized protein n=1 Tax=Angustibacter luteus TaxID=658456 RepID=A0ABW1JD59_9ACTN